MIVNDAEFNDWFSKRSKVKHKNVTSVIRYGAIPGKVHYIVSENPFGETLLEALHTDGEMKAKICVYVADQILDALVELKKYGMFHGNLMPSKCLLIEHSDNPHLLKLAGLSLPEKCFTKLQEKTGSRFPEVISPLYVSPERVEGGPPCESSEIYSVGALMYECLSGIPAYTAKSREELHKKHTEGQLLPLTGVAPELAIPPMIDDFVMKAMSMSPKDRFATFEEMRDRLLDPAERSTIYGLEDEDMSFMPPVIYKRLTQENPVLTESMINEIENEAKQKEAAEEKAEADKLNRELMRTVEGLQRTSKALMLVVVVAFACIIYLILQKG